MSIPSTEFKPDRFRTQPQGQIRAFLGDATEQEAQGFLEVLRQRAAIKPLTFILQLALAVVLFILGLAYELPVLFLLGVLVLPVFSALVSLALSPGLGSFKTMAISLVVILVIVFSLFGGGYLATQLNITQSQALPPLFDFVLNNGWIEWVALIIAAILTAVWFTTNNAFARVGALVFNLLAFVPFLLAGWHLGMRGVEAIWPPLGLGFLRLLAALLVMIIVLWFFRIQPKGTVGWLIVMFLAIALGLMVWQSLTAQGLIPEKTPEAPFKEIVITPAATIEPTVPPTPTLVPTQMPPTPTPTAMPSPTPEPTPTMAPREARVGAADGLRCRDLPAGNQIVWLLNHNAMVTLLNQEETVAGRVWQKIRATDDIECWVDGSLLIIQTP